MAKCTWRLLGLLFGALLPVLLFPLQLSAQQTPKTITMEVQPYAKMIFPFTQSLKNIPEACMKQEQLYKELAAEKELVPTIQSCFVREDNVVVTTLADNDVQALAQLEAVIRAMERTFERDTYQVPATATIFHPIDGATRQRVGTAVLKRLYGMKVDGVGMREEGDRRLIFTMTGESPSPEKLTELLVPGHLCFMLLPPDIIVSYDRENATTTYTRNTKNLNDAEVIHCSYLVTDSSTAQLTSKIEIDNIGQPAIGFKLANDADRKHFAYMTERNIRRNLAIVIDGKVLSAPTIQGRINGVGIIVGNFTPEEVKRMVTLLNIGALPAPVKVVQ